MFKENSVVFKGNYEILKLKVSVNIQSKNN